MKWVNNRFLASTYAICLIGLVLVGCTSKEDPSEVLPLCNGHSCGDLVMVTTDTSSDGFHYLDPVLSPDGSRIAFTADWWSVPSDPNLTEDRPYTSNRQLVVIPVQAGIAPMDNLAEQGGVLIRLSVISLSFGGIPQDLSSILDDDKGDPLWADDHTLIFWLTTPRGNRLFRADISNLPTAPECLYLEPSDAAPSPTFWQHMAPALSPDGEWLVFIRSGCANPGDETTCTGQQLWALQMSTAGVPPADPVAFPLTSEVSRIEQPSWHPRGHRIVFSAGLDMSGGAGSGTELFTVDFDTVGLADYVAGNADMPLNNGLARLTFTEYQSGDPITGILNTSPVYSSSGNRIYFISTRRAPSVTLHDRNVWEIPAGGALDPEIVFFSREDDVDVGLSMTGNLMVFSSMMGFPNEMLDRLEEESYQRLQYENPDWSEVELRDRAKSERRQLEFFQGVMSHLFLFSGW